MLSRKYLIGLALSLNIFFYGSAFIVLSKGLDNPYTENTYMALRAHISNFHKTTFDRRESVTSLLSQFYSGELSRSDLEANLTPNSIFSLHSIESNGVISMTTPKPLPQIPEEYMGKDKYVYFMPSPQNAIAFAIMISLKDSRGFFKPHIATLRVRATVLANIRKVFPFDFTVYQQNGDQLQTLQSTLETQHKRWLDQKIANDNDSFFPKKDGYPNRIVADYVTTSDDGKKTLLVAFAINCTDDLKQTIVYTIPLLYDESGTITPKLVKLGLFFILSSLITAISLYFSLRPSRR